MIKECNTCTHKEVCSGSYDNVACQVDYEPKRVKCENGCVNERDMYIDKYDDGNFETRTVKNNYCPECGTKIEVKL